MSWKWHAWQLLDLVETMTPGSSVWRGTQIYRIEKSLEDVLEGKELYAHPIDNRLQKAAFEEARDNKEEWISDRKGLSKIIQGVLIDGAYSTLIAGMIGAELGNMIPEGYPSSLDEYVVFGAIVAGGMTIGGLKAHTHLKISGYYTKIKVKARLATNKHRFGYWKDSGKIYRP